MKPLIVRGAPSFYHCREGVLDQLESLLARYGFTKGLVIHGQKSWEAAAPFFPGMNDIALDFAQYRGECSDAETERIANLCRARNAQFVIGVGGGKVLDLAKAAAHAARIDPVLIPTLASTCAAWSSLSVIYSGNGAFERNDYFPRTSLMVLVEPRLLLNSPLNYLKAGIGDTLAKWYECEALTRNLPAKRMPVKLALNSAKLCKDIVAANGFKAIQALKQGELTAEFVSIVELNIMIAGTVGGFGDHYARVAAAHSVHNGLTRLPETHHLLHGEKVAYGILVQLALEQNWREIGELLSLYRALELPGSLAALGLADADDERLAVAAKAALAPDESIHYLRGDITAREIVDAMRKLETMC